MKKINFNTQDLEKARTQVLEAAYLQYSGVKQFPLTKEVEYEFMLECAETDCRNAGRNLQKEAYDLCENELWGEVSISLFGQWKKSNRHFDACTKRVQRLFTLSEFTRWVELHVKAKYSYKYDRYHEVSRRERKYIREAYLGIIPDIQFDWAT